eukprot:gnl/MRDRNA2_/MRDRNA2_32584_c0_seq1.p1 gnl/MRDRNA2_/MRDRNA2_32584_c0~~gnl/MRDRNA2_/MRDRNA2_32584_c0_seq1.p1  ORF type:complete len:321 (-),score=36.14 gnl/MRDRNA2_/MRDRNA2_32584_c0_seq1:43-1005(-)
MSTSVDPGHGKSVSQISSAVQQEEQGTIVRQDTSLEIEELTPGCGAVVHNIDIRHATGPVMRELHSALMQYRVLFFRGQTAASDDDFVAFGRRWGELEGPHPILKLNDQSPIAVVAHDKDQELQWSRTPKKPTGNEWHVDCSWSQNPPFASLLWSKVLPHCGGDTLWLNTTRAFKALPSGLQETLRGLSAVHDFGVFRNRYATDGGDAMTEGFAKFGAAVHPIVRMHPFTGEPCLFVNESFTMHVVGMTSPDSRRLLEYLFSHINRPDFQVRWRWQLGDAALYDNRNTQHCPVADYEGQSRKMHRVTILEDNLIQSKSKL